MKKIIAFCGILLVAIFYQNCSGLQSARLSNVTTQNYGIEIGEGLTFVDDSDEHLKSINFTNNLDQAQVTIGLLQTDKVVFQKGKSVSLASRKKQLEQAVQGLAVELITPEKFQCELINAPPFLVLAPNKSNLLKLALTSSQIPERIEIGKRMNSCDPFYDLIGTNRQKFLLLLSQISDELTPE